MLYIAEILQRYFSSIVHSLKILHTVSSCTSKTLKHSIKTNLEHCNHRRLNRALCETLLMRVWSYDSQGRAVLVLVGMPTVECE